MAAKRPKRGSHPANSFWYYNNWDFNAAGTIFENLTGRGIYEEFEDQLARPLKLLDFRRERDTGYVGHHQIQQITLLAEIEYTRDQWSRPACLLKVGVRPCSLIHTTSVSSSMPRCRRSLINAAHP